MFQKNKSYHLFQENLKEMSKLIATLKQNNYEGDLDISTESPSLKKSPTFDFSCKFEENAFDKDDVIFFLNPCLFI